VVHPVAEAPRIVREGDQVAVLVGAANVSGAVVGGVVGLRAQHILGARLGDLKALEADELLMVVLGQAQDLARGLDAEEVGPRVVPEAREAPVGGRVAGGRRGAM